MLISRRGRDAGELQAGAAPSARRRLIVPTLSALVAALVAIAPGVTPPVHAQGLLLTAPYPAVSVQPGTTASFDLVVSADEPIRVDLSVEGVPDGWTTTLRGGGRVVSSVFAGPDEPPELVLDVDVPDNARAGTTTITVVGSAAGETSRLPLDVTVVTGGGGEVALTADVPARSGTADDTFDYTLELSNDTPQQLTFELQAMGPRGWTVTIEASGQAGATSVTVDARGSETISVQATPPAQVTEGSFPLRAEAVAGEQSAAIDLAAEVTGRVEMELTTPDERLNTTASAGSPQELDVLVNNLGTAPLVDLSLSGSGPSEWEVTFDPATLQQVSPGDSVAATAVITPSANAVAGDYVVTLSATGEGIDESVDIRVTVETPPIWGIVGIALIVLTLVALGWVFRRYGRR